MDNVNQKQQWTICFRCGNGKVRNPETMAKLIAKGMTQQEAEEYMADPGFLVCPTPERHNTPMVLQDELQHGAYYFGKCRNATVARWNAETKQFIYMRYKFGEVFPEAIGYFVEAKPGEHRFDEFEPFGLLNEPPFEIPLTEN